MLGEGSMAAEQCQELPPGYLGLQGLSAPFIVLHRQALLAAVGTAKKVIVAGAKLRAPSGVGSPVMRGRSSEALYPSAPPFTRTVTSCKFAASRVYRSDVAGNISECGALRSELMTRRLTPPGVSRWQCAYT